ncbi:hypothetical protein PFISCL1PPCAC_8942, partial [Pristionchus fissidentatus]
VAADPDFANRRPLEFLSREERIDAQAKKCKHLMEKVYDLVDMADLQELVHLTNEVFGTDGFPLTIHFVAFIPFLKSQADADILSEFLPRSLTIQVIGTYAQTEMGHGEN